MQVCLEKKQDKYIDDIQPVEDIVLEYVDELLTTDKDKKIKYLERCNKELYDFAILAFKHLNVESLLQDICIPRNSESWEEYSKAKRILGDIWFNHNDYSDYTNKICDYIGL